MVPYIRGAFCVRLFATFISISIAASFEGICPACIEKSGGRINCVKIREIGPLQAPHITSYREDQYFSCRGRDCLYSAICVGCKLLLE